MRLFAGIWDKDQGEKKNLVFKSTDWLEIDKNDINKDFSLVGAFSQMRDFS